VSTTGWLKCLQVTAGRCRGRVACRGGADLPQRQGRAEPDFKGVRQPRQAELRIQATLALGR
jgi:hypothetical protein